jgi:predicted ribosomally synthesized peptide with SipW-like signal peptide
VKQVRKILASLMIIAVLAASITAGAMAVFTDQQTNPDNVFTTGTVILGIDRVKYGAG